VKPLSAAAVAICVLAVASAPCLCQAGPPAPVAEPDASTPGSIPEDETSLHCIGLRWFVKGDANRNASVEVAYRRAGQDKWLPAMALFRVESEAMEDRQPPVGEALFAGSIFGLDEGTDYQVRLSLNDPDGGSCRKIIRRRTWSAPIAPSPRRTLHVAPGKGGGSGTEEHPFRGLPEAAEQAGPGDLLLLKEGVYRGPLRMVNDGEPEAPIVWRGPEEGQAVIEGPPNGTAVIAQRRKYIHIERLTIRNARQAVAVDGAKHLVIRRCTMTGVHKGISDDALANRIYVADNVIEGMVAYPQKHKGEDRGIELSGTGHVICYNRIRGFRDAVDTRFPYPVRDVDIHNNDISECEDDGIELDFAEHNIRAYENRLTNCSMGISFQPSRGGPNYAIRNVLYNIRGESFKLHLTPTNRKAPDWKVGPHRTSGGVIIHNTIIKEGTAFRVWSDEGPAHYFRVWNNLFVGSPAYYCIDIGPPMRWADFDYNAYVAEGFKKFANWNEKKYDTFAQFRRATGLEQHGLVLKKFAGIFAETVMLPTDWKVVEPIAKNAPALHAQSPVVDKGRPLPTINDDFRGKAPDLGAWELGQVPPHYGPRGQ